MDLTIYSKIQSYFNISLNIFFKIESPTVWFSPLLTSNSPITKLSNNPIN